MRLKFSLLLLLILFVFNVPAQNAPLNMVNNEYKLTWIYPKATTKEVGKYDKLEFGIRLSEKVTKQINDFISGNEGLNPYDPSDISITFSFISPTMKEKTVYGFYYQEYERTKESWNYVPTTYNWRIRFAPDELGRWSFIMKIYIKNEEVASIGSKFQCVPSEKKGIIRRNYKGDATDRYLYLSETKETFFTIGHNIAHAAYYKLTPQKAERHQQWLTELANYGGNFFRLELGAPNGLPDWNNYKDYTTKMAHMWEFDALLEHARNLDLYFILFRHHTEMLDGESWDVAKWQNNPYKLGFNLEERKDYFTNKEVIKWQKNALRYIFSRWGYNTSFAFYEYQEIDLWLRELKKETGYNDKTAIEFFTEWYKIQKEYIRNDLGYDQLFINTYATTPDYELSVNSQGLFANSDVIGFHKYGQDKDINYESRFDKAAEIFATWNKPLFVEEMGVSAGGSSDFLPLYKCSDVEFKNSIWATSFMGGVGTGLNWWWDRGIHDYGYYKAYQPLKEFFTGENMEEEKYTPQKWHNKLSLNRAFIENYALVNSTETKVLGWVHNASVYWRNLSSDCMQELVVNRKFDQPHKLKDGYVIGDDKSMNTNFSDKTDAYTKAGIQKVGGETFDIKGLKAGGFFSKKKWYEIQFYSTQTGKFVEKQMIPANMWGKLKPTYPAAGLNDYAYKINYVGEGEKPE